MAASLSAQVLTAGGDITVQQHIGDVIQAAPPIATSLHQLPPPPHDFTGREAELTELTAVLEKGGVTISGVRGMGGVGKTALALQLAEQLAPHYPDAQFYLDLKGINPTPLSPAEAMAHIIRAYHPTDRLPVSEAELTGKYLSALYGQRALLPMDNAANAAQVAPLIPPINCVLLVTSRQHFTLPGLYAKNLEEFPPADAQALLLAISPRIGDHAEEIAKLCGYLPLALRAVGSLLAVTADISPAIFVTQLHDERKRLERIGAEGVDLSVEASFNLSYTHLEAEFARVFRMLAVFPGSFYAQAEEVVCEDASHAHLSDLMRRSLVEWNPTTARYRLHDLVRLFADHRLTESERNIAQWRHAVQYESVLRAANATYLEGGESVKRGLFLFDLEWENIRAGQAWAERQAGEDDAAAKLCSDYPSAGPYCLILRQHLRERIRWLEAALGADRRLKDRAAEGRHLGHLGLAYRELSEPRRAIEFHEQQLLIARDIGDRKGEGVALGNLGVAYHELNENRRAIELHEQALNIYREVGFRRGESDTLGNLGLAYMYLGELRRAIEFYEQGLVISHEIDDPPSRANFLNNLGITHEQLGEFRRAIELYTQALEIYRDVGSRRGEGYAVGNLGSAYYQSGEPQRALEFFERQLIIAREIGDRRSEANALRDIGTANSSLGRPHQAIQILEQAMAIYDEIEYRFGKVDALESIGKAYSLLGDLHRAIEIYKQSAAIARELDHHKGEAEALRSMSETLYNLGDRTEAIAQAEVALRLFEQAEDRRAATVRDQLTKWRGESNH